MQIPIAVAPVIFDWVKRNVSLETLDSDLVYRFEEWEKGEKSPTFKQIEDFSKATHIPFGYFFLKTPPKEKIELLEFRTIDSIDVDTPNRDIVDIVSEMTHIQDWMHTYFISEGRQPNSFVASFNLRTDVKTASEKIKQALNLKADWYKDISGSSDAINFIRERASELGIVVMQNGIVGNNTHRKLDISVFRAFTLIDNYAPLVFINATDSKSGKLFSLLHEIVHIGLGKSDFYNDRNGSGKTAISKQTEKFCNAVATEILVPSAEFQKNWVSFEKQVASEERIEKLAKSFKCSTTVIARKALDNRYIGVDIYTAIANEAIENYHLSQQKKKEDGASGGNYYATLGTRFDSRFLSGLINSVQAGRTTYTEAFRLTKTNSKTFFEICKRRGEGNE